jgi:hypothetical protein
MGMEWCDGRKRDLKFATVGGVRQRSPLAR